MRLNAHKLRKGIWSLCLPCMGVMRLSSVLHDFYRTYHGYNPNPLLDDRQSKGCIWFAGLSLTHSRMAVVGVCVLVCPLLAGLYTFLFITENR